MRKFAKTKSCIFGLLVTLTLLISSCGEESEGTQPQEPSGSYLTLFNAEEIPSGIDVFLGDEQVLSGVRAFTFSKYYPLNSGEIEVTVKESNTETVLLTTSITLDAGHFYSSYFHRAENAGYSLTLSKDYSEEERNLKANADEASRFFAINLSESDLLTDYSIYIKVKRIISHFSSNLQDHRLFEDLTYLDSQQLTFFPGLFNGIQFFFLRGSSEPSVSKDWIDIHRLDYEGQLVENLPNQWPKLWEFFPRDDQNHSLVIFDRFHEENGLVEPTAVFMTLNRIEIFEGN